MKKSNQILLITDGSLRRTPAVLRAMSLARKLDAVILLRSFEYQRKLAQATQQGFDLDAYLRGRRNRLEEFAGQIREEEVTVDCAVVWGAHPAEKIIFEVLALKPDLVIKDAAAASIISRAFYSGLDWRLLAECPAPLMLVHSKSRSLPTHLLAAVDPLDEHGKPHALNAEILKTAISLSAQCGAELDVANAYEFTPTAAECEYLGWMPDVTLYEEMRKAHAEALYALGKRHGIAPSQMHVLDGDPARAIIGFAETRKVDLVVMGSVYRSPLKHFFIGSTAEGVFDSLGCDVLALKPEGFAAELAARLESPKPKAA